jgi:hypothetical protein
VAEQLCYVALIERIFDELTESLSLSAAAAAATASPLLANSTV